MRIEIGDCSSDVFPTDEEIKEVCKVGQGSDCCVWLVCGPNGFQCMSMCKSKVMQLFLNWKDGKTNAKRDGCDKINNFDILSPYNEGDVVEI